jgi:FtsZ-binding cell division protein ZapB
VQCFSQILEKMKNTFDKTVYSLCLEIDELKEEVKYWREKYEEEKNANAKMLDENLQQAKQGVANALRFALSVQDDENGNLVISKENRQSLAETWS